VIAREIFMQEAQKRGLEGSEDYKVQLELARQTILIRELFADYQKNNPVTDAEIQGRVRQVRGSQRRQGIQGQPHPGRKRSEAKAIIAA
jgi:peptidyl-prolyl cis-trans isomerase C